MARCQYFCTLFKFVSGRFLVRRPFCHVGLIPSFLAEEKHVMEIEWKEVMNWLKAFVKKLIYANDKSLERGQGN